MPLREFRDEGGRLWQVCNVQLDAIERRSGRERRSRPRGGVDRRRRRQSRIVVAPRYRAGWLVFDSGGDRRRLAPIPPGWEYRTVEELRELLHDAEPLKVAW